MSNHYLNHYAVEDFSGRFAAPMAYLELITQRLERANIHDGVTLSTTEVTAFLSMLYTTNDFFSEVQHALYPRDTKSEPEISHPQHRRHKMADPYTEMNLIRLNSHLNIMERDLIDFSETWHSNTKTIPQRFNDLRALVSTMKELQEKLITGPN